MPDDHAAPDAAQLYRDLAPAVLGYLRGLRVPEPEDVLGEVFLQVARDLERRRFRPRSTGDPSDARRRWVFSIAHNRAMDAHRRSTRRGRHVADASLDDLEAAGRTAAADAERDDIDHELVAALATLSAEQRETVALRFIGDLSLEEVAQITGRSVGAVKALQHRGIERLRKSLGDPYPEGPLER